MQTRRSTFIETALNVAIGTSVVFIITGHIGETSLIVGLSFLRMYTLRRIFTDKGK